MEAHGLDLYALGHLQRDGSVPTHHFHGLDTVREASPMKPGDPSAQHVLQVAQRKGETVLDHDGRLLRPDQSLGSSRRL